MRRTQQAPADRDHTKLPDALAHATSAADGAQLPMTVYRDSSTCGWWYGNSFKTCLYPRVMPGVTVEVTVLPKTYFNH